MCREREILLSRGPGLLHPLLWQPGVLPPLGAGRATDGDLQTGGLCCHGKSVLRQQPAHSVLSSVWSLHTLCWWERGNGGQLWTFVILYHHLNKRVGEILLKLLKGKKYNYYFLNDVQLSCLNSTQRTFWCKSQSYFYMYSYLVITVNTLQVFKWANAMYYPVLPSTTYKSTLM